MPAFPPDAVLVHGGCGRALIKINDISDDKATQIQEDSCSVWGGVEKGEAGGVSCSTAGVERQKQDFAPV